MKCKLTFNDGFDVYRKLIKYYNTDIPANEVISKLVGELSASFDFNYATSDVVTFDMINIIGMPLNILSASVIDPSLNKSDTANIIKRKMYYEDASVRLNSQISNAIQQYQNKINNIVEVKEQIDEKKTDIDENKENGIIEDTTEGDVEHVNEISYTSKLEIENLNDLYKDAVLVNMAMQDRFKKSLISNMFINLDSGSLVNNSEQLNINIKTYINKLISSIVNYSELIDKPLVRKSLYFTTIGKNDIDYLNEVLGKAPELFGTVTSQRLSSSYINQNDIMSKSFIDAYNAYAILNNFDNMIESTLGNIVSINMGLFNNFDYIINKYNIKVNNNLTSTWRTTEDVDAVKEVGSLSKMLIEITPYKSFEGEISPNRYLKPEEFVQAFAKLKTENISNLFPNNEPKLIKLDPNKYIRESLEYILENGYELSEVFSKSDLDIYRSAYDMFFRNNYDGKSYSIYETMLKEQNNGTKIEGLNLYNVMLGTIDKVEKVTYIQYSNPYGSDEVRIGTINERSTSVYKIHLESDLNITYNLLEDSDRISLAEEYEVNIGNPRIESFVEFKLDDNNIIRTNLVDEILINNKPLDKKFFANLSNSEFEQALSSLSSPTESVSNLLSLLTIVDNLMNTNILNGRLDLFYGYKDLSDKNYLENLVHTVGKILWNNSVNIKAKESNIDLKNYAINTNLFKNSNRGIESFYNNKLGNLNIFFGNRTQTVLSNLAESEAMLNGELYKNNVKNLSGNMASISRITNLIKNIYGSLQINKRRVIPSEDIMSDSLFRTNYHILKDVHITSDGSDILNNQIKSSGKFNIGEIGQTSILYDFIESFYLKNEYYIHPIVFSDKTSHYKLLIDSEGFINISNPLTNEEYQPKQLKDLTARELYNYNYITQYNIYNKLKNNLLVDYTNAFSMLTDEELVLYGLKKADVNMLTWNKVKFVMSKLNADIYNDIAKRARLAGLQSDVVTEVHYSRAGGTFGVNGTIDNYLNIYTIDNPNETDINKVISEKYKERLNRGKGKLLRSIFQNNINFNYVNENGFEIPMLTEIIKQQNLKKKGWIDENTGSLIIAKKGSTIINSTNYEKYLTESNIRNVNNGITINPLLNMYYLHNLFISNNFNTAIIGAPYIHPAPGNINPDETDISNNITKEELEESLRYLAQLKRMVILPATLHPYTQNLVEGVTPEIEIAVIEDLVEYASNFTGLKNEKVDIYDGSGFINALQTILENNSLGDSAVGFDLKPIGHSFNNRYGSAALLKFALFSIDNEKMRSYPASNVSLRNLFRKMTNKTWDFDIDITKNFKGENIIIPDNIYYFNKFENQYNKLLDIQSLGNNQYKVITQTVDNLGNEIGKIIETTKIIDTNFKIWEVLGGEFSSELINGKFVYTNKSLYDTVNYINNVGYLKTEENQKLHNIQFDKVFTNDYFKNNILTQEMVYQPLKNKMTAYAVNKSGMKNGSMNLNKSNVYKNLEYLDTMTIDTTNIGIQLDADHKADESELTEMSQVITALAELGNTQPLVKKTYNNLAKVVYKSLSNEIDAINKYYNPSDNIPNKQEIYNILAKALIRVHSSSERNSVGLAKSILDAINNEFNNKTEESKLKIPFSDPNIMSSALSTITSSISKSSIKRKYPGIASVLLPSHSIVQTFRTNTETSIKFDKLVSERLTINPEYLNDEDLIIYNDIASQYNPELTNYNLHDFISINYRIAKYKQEGLNREFFNTDDDYNNYLLEQIYIEDKIRPLRNMTNQGQILKSNQIEFMESYSVYSDGEFIEDVVLSDYDKYIKYRDSEYDFKLAYHIPQDLKPARAQFKVGRGIYSVYDTDIVRHVLENEGNVNNDTKKEVQNMFVALDKGFTKLSTLMVADILIGKLDLDGLDFYYLSERGNYELLNQEVNLLEIDINSNVYVKVDSLKIEEAELILPKIYKSKFDLDVNDSLSDVKDYKFFYNKMKNKLKVKTSNYDIAFLNSNGDNTYITFNNELNLKEKNINIINLDGIDYRSNEFGEPLYELTGLKVLEQLDGIEVILVEDPSNVSSLYNTLNPDSIDFNILGDAKKISIFITHPDNKNNMKYISNNFENSVEYFKGDVNKALESIVNNKNIWQDEMLHKKAKEKYSSFIISLDFIAARIPSQAMQSFMSMKVKEFSDNDTNTAYVSHYQIWLQGSDFDIDKVYLMGSEFNDNGIYVGWSPLFDYSTPQKLRQSLDIPTPNYRTYNITHMQLGSGNEIKEGDISNYIIDLINENNLFKEIGDDLNLNSINKLLDYIDNIEGNELLINLDIINDYFYEKYKGADINSAVKLLNKLINKHNNYQSKNLDNSVKEFKNSVSSNINKISRDLKNYVASHSPVDMNAPKDAAKTSLLGKDSQTLLGDNPSTNWTMQFQNMTGRDVIGIAAVGVKVFFTLSYYYNEGVKNKSNYENMLFDRKFNIGGKEISRNIITNVNFDEYSKALEYFSNKIEQSLSNKITDINYSQILEDAIKTQITGNQEDAALIISALLSAATDNAKELLLAKINAGSDFASIYVYAIVLGIDFNTIAELMKSKTVINVSKLMEGNIFNDTQKMSLDSIYKFFSEVRNVEYNLKDDIKLVTYKFPYQYAGLYKFKMYEKKIIDKMMVSPNKEVDNEYRQLLKHYKSNLKTIDDIINIALVDEKFERVLLNAFKYMQKGSNLGILFNRTYNRIKTLTNYYKNSEINFKELETLKQLKDLSGELTDLGRMLKVNQGLPTTITDMYRYKQNIEQRFFTQLDNLGYIRSNLSDSDIVFKILAERILAENKLLDINESELTEFLKDNSDILNSFSFDKYMDDIEYKNNSIKIYNYIKGTFNILDIIDKVPHFKAMIEALHYSDKMMRAVSVRYNTAIDVLNKISMNPEYSGTAEYVSLKPDQINAVSNTLNDYVINKWLNNIDTNIYVNVGQKVFDKNHKLNDLLTNNYYLNLGIDYDQATFKHWMEKSVLPMLRHGNTDEGEFQQNLRSNKFIQGLKITSEQDKLTSKNFNKIKLDINLTNLNNDFDKAKYQEFIIDFNKLQYYNINGTPIIELLFLYNTIVNKNRFGSTNLTKMFENFISNNKSELINSYFEFIGNIDYNNEFIENQDYFIEDVLLQTAPVIQQYELKKFGGIYAKIYNPKTNSYSVYKNKDLIRFNDLDVNYFRMNNSKLSLENDVSISDLDLNKFSDEIKRLISTNQLKININCE